MQELKDLQEMKEAGALNEEEYAAAKAKVLSAGKPAAKAEDEDDGLDDEARAAAEEDARKEGKPHPAATRSVQESAD